MVNRAGWVSGNALSFIITGSGRRNAWSYDGSAGGAPILVVEYTTSSDLPLFPTIANGGSVASNTGTDILFTDLNGKKLDHEIESYESLGALRAWVRIPSLSATANTEIYMYYGNPDSQDQQTPQGVWSNDYRVVQHLQKDPANSLTRSPDSTSYANHGTVAGMVYEDKVQGKIGDAYSFDGDNNSVDISQNDSINNLSTVTLSAWIYAGSGSDESGSGRILDKGSDFIWYHQDTTNRIVFDHYRYSTQGSWQTSTAPITDGNWYHVAVTYDYSSTTNDPIFYVNGAVVSTSENLAPTGSLTDYTESLHIGNNQDYTRTLNGTIDEARVSSTIKSADWIATEYNNQSAPSTFVTDGAEEKAPGPVIHWKFDENQGQTANNSASSDNNGQRGSTSGSDAEDPTWKPASECVSGSCFFFDGTDDYVVKGNNKTIDLNDDLSNGFTWQAWIKANSDGENPGSIISKGPITRLSVTNEGTDGKADLAGALDLATADASVTATDAITLNKWHHVAMAWTNDADDEISLYVDGVLVGTSTNGSGNVAAENNNLYVGGYTTNNFHGYIDEVKVYRQERTATQIKSDASVSFSSQNTSLSTGLVGYWKMDEASGNFIDYSGNSYTANVNGTTVVGGKFGNGRSFNGTSDYANTLSTIDLSNDSKISVAFWLKGTTANTDKVILESSNNFNNNTGSIMINPYDSSSCGGSSSVSYKDQSISPGYRVECFSQPSAGIWHFWVATFDYSNQQDIRIYIDGAEVATTIGGSGAYTGDFLNGNFGNYNWYFMNRGGASLFNQGTLDEVRVYKRALSPQEVQQLYQWAPNPLLYYKFDDATGTSTVVDSSGNGTSGTMNGSMTESDWVAGKYGSALEFDGTDDYVEIGSSAKVDNSPHGTIMAWVKPYRVDQVQSIFNYGGGCCGQCRPI